VLQGTTCHDGRIRLAPARYWSARLGRVPTAACVKDKVRAPAQRPIEAYPTRHNVDDKRPVDVARAKAELRDTLRAGHLADSWPAPQFTEQQPRGWRATPVGPETVQALAGLDVQGVFVPELVAAARAADTDG